MRIEAHVRPRASRTQVGGAHQGALVVGMVEAADTGRATEAMSRAVAAALALRRRLVSLVRGTTTRGKLLEVDVDHDAARVTATVEGLVAGRPVPGRRQPFVGGDGA